VRNPRLNELRRPAAVVSVLRDGFDKRTPVWGWRVAGGPTTVRRAPDPAAEEAACAELLGSVGQGGSLCHAGGFSASLYEFVDRMTDRAADIVALEGRAVDLMSIVRGAWVFPDVVRHPAQALAWMQGEPPEGEQGQVALCLEAGDWDELEAIATAELDALEALLAVLTETEESG
jgi:hypothetical protein